MNFAEYVNHGWALCRIRHSEKRPTYKRWNTLEKAIRDPNEASNLPGAGLLHAFSGTCTLDVDDWDLTEDWFREHYGLDLKAFFDAPDAVQIVSGTANHGKLLFALDAPLPTVKLAEGAFELRCGTKSGNNSAQDVLPPSVHPNGAAYQWSYNELITHWSTPPALPDELRRIWLDVVGPPRDVLSELPEPSTDLDELRELVQLRDPGADYETWLETLAIIHHETRGSPDGLRLAIEWSRPSWRAERSAYGSCAEEIEAKWSSFGHTDAPVTADTLRRERTADVGAFETFEAEPAEFDAAPAMPSETEQNEEPPNRWQYLTLSELRGLPEPEWIIDSILPRSDLGTIYGQPGSGKTFIALDVAFAVARGENWRGAETQQGGVLYVAAEDDAGVRLRINAYAGHHGLEADPPLLTLCDAPNLVDAEERKPFTKATVRAAKRINASVIVVDTLASVAPGADENSVKDVTVLIDYCKKLHKATGAMVLLVHHEGKTQGRGPRGSSAWHGAFAVELFVAQDLQGRSVTMNKVKNAADGAVYPFELKEAGDSCVVEHHPERPAGEVEMKKRLGYYEEKVIEAIDQLSMFDEDGVTQQDVVNKVCETVAEQPDTKGRDQRAKNIRRAIRELERAGHVIVQNDVVTLPGAISDE